MAAISFQQNIVRVVHLEVVQGGHLNTLIPNTCLQQPMSGKPGLPPRYDRPFTTFFKYIVYNLLRAVPQSIIIEFPFIFFISVSVLADMKCPRSSYRYWPI